MGMFRPDALAQVTEESISRLESGGIPVVAEQRLQALRGSASALFTSNLSVNEFILTRAWGLRPVSQVMGSCVYHQRTAAQLASWNLAPGETHRLSMEDDLLAVRETALNRLRLEAQACGALAVTGVHIRQSEQDSADSGSALIEFVATGTAVVDEAAGPAEQDPVLTSLSVQDYWKLVLQGFNAVGVVFTTNMVGRHPGSASPKGRRALGMLTTAGRDVLNDWGLGGLAAAAAPKGRERPEFSAAVTDVYAYASADLRAQAERLGAEGIVGLRIDRDQFTDGNQNMILIVHTIGTAIASVSGPSPGFGAGAAPLSVTPVRRLEREGGDHGEPRS
jgi:uncharacterized protein YbjQ (UPF0145 family)